jgi:ethanolamine utilization protein EutN
MFIGKITGTVISTHKVDSMKGQKLLIVEPLRIDEQNRDSLKSTGRTFIVVDCMGVGEGEIVLCVQGSSARYTEQTKTLPIDAAVIGIIDRVQLGEQTVYKNEE